MTQQLYQRLSVLNLNLNFIQQLRKQTNISDQIVLFKLTRNKETTNYLDRQEFRQLMALQTLHQNIVKAEESTRHTDNRYCLDY